MAFDFESELAEIAHTTDFDPKRCTLWIVRVLGLNEESIDGLPAYKTKDILGYGNSLREAATTALVKRIALLSANETTAEVKGNTHIDTIH